jgi:acetyltransferase-like isoleucine patch superfamily enzyme
MLDLLKIKATILHFIFVYPRILKYNLLSDVADCVGAPKKNQPILMCGQGSIRFGKNVVMGTNISPFFYNGYTFLNARNRKSEIYFDNGVWVNNNLIILCEGEGVYIGKDTLVGANVEIYDSDFHEIYPFNRKYGSAKNAKVIIGNNVWLGSNVKVLKGVTIGDNSIIANSSIVTKSIPENVIAGGIPAKIIKYDIDKFFM